MARSRGRTGPANLGKMGPGLRARGPAARKSRARMPRTGKAGPSVRIPNGAAGGIAKATSSLIRSPKGRVTSRPAGRPTKKINLHPRADGVSRI